MIVNETDVNNEIATLNELLETCRSTIANPMFPSPQKRSEMVQILYDRGKCYAVTLLYLRRMLNMLIKCTELFFTANP